MANEMNEALAALHGELNNVLANVDLSDVTADSTGFQALPDGYYCCEVEKAELKISKTSKKPMVAFTMKVTEDGQQVVATETDSYFKPLKKTKGRKIFMYYVLKDETSVKRFATDMLKFEGEEKGVPILEKEYFLNADVLEDALDIITGMRIYVQVSTTVNDDETTSTWNNLISWKRAEALELPL